MDKLNKDIVNNTVKASNQVKLNQHFLGDYENANAPKIMFIGNSITLHESKPDIGWNFNHGMAASEPEKDYVHLVIKKWEIQLNKKVAALVYNAADYEREYNKEATYSKILNQAKLFKPDVVVFRLGENVYKENLQVDDVKKSFEFVIKELRKMSKFTVITGLFWGFEQLDKAIKEISIEENIPYVRLDDLGEQDENKAIGKFEHMGVQLHPGDLGMERIAERIYKEISKFKVN